MNFPVARRRALDAAALREAVGWRIPARWRNWRYSWKRDLSRDAMILLGVLVGLAQANGIFAAPVDGLMYWEAGTSPDLYPDAWSQITNGQVPYPPPIAQVSTLLQPIGWPAFIFLLTTGTFAAFWYCARQWSLPLIALGIPWLFLVRIGEPTFLAYALIGNLQWILAALSVVAIKHPSLWSIELVTKVTTGIGWWWHVLRGEWRAAAIGGLATLVVLVVSVATAPAIWADYLSFAARSVTTEAPILTFPVPFAVRLAMAIPLLIWGARTNRAWVVPAACGWSLVGLYNLGFLPFFVAAWRARSVVQTHRSSHPRDAAADV
jgi:hypothetical protein